ncbi:beta-lactamase family protein [Fulvivirga ligni]|uniref:beta-lactamase family protein n=1 Tax=Fulvivirga ligni TaxID=2904246 RepID=UPI001F31FD0B|nr:beta-lactamase family protein [Fulvivirga ligni]UII21695.1 beta-lactamase family protein [Fulvivirga ligni]
MKRSILLFIFLCYQLNLYGQEPELNAKLASYLQVIHRKKVFSGELLVARGEKILFQKAIGMASYENQLELKPGAKYKIASITKTFTGTLLLMAQSEGLLKLDDKAIDYISELSPQFKDITIRQLLTHTSGLPHNEGIKEYWQVKSKLQMSVNEVINEINQLSLLSTLGSEFHYSSLGYFLLATIIERVYHDAYANVLKQKILQPLDMTETGAVNSLTIVKGMAAGYHLVSDDSLVVAPYRNYSMLKGAGDMYSSAQDLLKWANSFFQNELLDQKQKPIIFSPNVNAGKYGLGWYVEDGLKYYHGGGTWGYSSSIAMYPESQISIILLSNVSTLPVSDMADDIEKIVFNQPFEMPVVQEAQASVLPLDTYSGKYISDSGQMILTISSSNNHLYAQLAGNPAFEIYPKGDHQFYGKKIEIEMVFETSQQKVTGLSAERMGRTFHFKAAD